MINHAIPLAQLVGNDGLFSKVPGDWFIVIADVQNSTKAIERGLHNDVNMAATGSIVSVLNEVKQNDPAHEIPYFFGGDGVTFIIPPVLHDSVLDALAVYRNHIQQSLNLTLYTGSLLVEEVYREEKTLKIAKANVTEQLTIPVVVGSGLKYAERHIKDNFVLEEADRFIGKKPNLEGFECRWNQILPDEESKKVICLLIDCMDESRQSQVYSEILYRIEEIFGNHEMRNPISVAKLKLDLSWQRIQREFYMRVGEHKWLSILQYWMLNLFGPMYFSISKEGKNYLNSVSKRSDTIMLDGLINMVIVGTPPQVNALEKFLNDRESAQHIIYGMHITNASIMSCYVEDRVDQHIHFVDGNQGGYTTAAKMLKEKFSAKA
ncbi:DUF3095 domain-containing protein [Gangjinia marincola]|uniref:DUF3095 domain-containing protein n=1 Tax=Gangjinia marincola TaxID=578463 RepID=A0ABN1MIS4_9FLAO